MRRQRAASRWCVSPKNTEPDVGKRSTTTHCETEGLRVPPSRHSDALGVSSGHAGHPQARWLEGDTRRGFSAMEAVRVSERSPGPGGSAPFSGTPNRRHWTMASPLRTHRGPGRRGYCGCSPGRPRGPSWKSCFVVSILIRSTSTLVRWVIEWVRFSPPSS